MNFLARGASVAAVFCFSSIWAGAEDTPWFDLKKQGRNFYDIVKIEDLREAEREASEDRDLTRMLLEDPALYEEEEGNVQFKRWKNFIEPRVEAHGGDLSVLAIGQQEMLKMVPLNGEPLPPMQGKWEPLGPFASNTFGAGRLNWIEFHPTDNNVYMVGAASGGLWFTRDNGATWTTTTDKLAVLGAAWGVYHPTNPSIIYLGTGDGDHSDTKSIGVLKSTDGGQTWNTTGLTYPISGGTQIQKLLIHPTDGNRVWVATSSGVQYSTNGGTSFQASQGISGKIWDLEFHPTNPDIIYASSTAFYRSTNGGQSFSTVAGVTAGRRMLIAVSPAQPDNVWALRGAQSSTEGLSRSTNQGQSFSSVSGNATTVGCNQTWYDYAFDVSPTNANELTAGCLRIFRSSDGGANWAQHGSSYHVDIHGTTYRRRDGTLFTVNDGGVWRSVSGGTTWTNLNNNLNIGQSYRLGVLWNDYDVVCTGRQDNGSDVRGSSAGFRQAIGGDGMECFFNLTGTRMYGESQNGAFRRCSYANGAVSGCTSVTSGLPGGSWDTPWGQDPNNNTSIFAGRQANIWKSTNEGTSWTQLGTMAGSTVRNFVVAPSNSNYIYAFKGSDVYATTNGGQSWTNVRGNLTGTPINGAVSKTNPSDIWVAVSGYTGTTKVWRSTTAGTTWTNQTLAGLPNIPANCVALDNLGQNGVYVGMDAGVFYKRDGMSSWQNFSDGLPNAIVKEMEIAQKGSNANDRRIVIATFGRGIWRSTLWENNPVPVKETEKLPALRNLKAKLAGNILELRFQLGTDRWQAGLSTIQLANVDGKVVFEERVPSTGVFERRVDLSRQGKGVFLFVLKNDRQRVTQRVMAY